MIRVRKGDTIWVAVDPSKLLDEVAVAKDLQAQRAKLIPSMPGVDVRVFGGLRESIVFRRRWWQ